MTTFWLLTGGYKWEGDEILGLFSSEEKAKEEQKKLEADRVYDYTSILCMTVDSYTYESYKL
jgi:hypothetical protein